MAMDDKHQQAEGIWQFKESIPVDDDKGKNVNDAITFAFHNGMVTLRLLTLRTGQWKSTDGFYTLAAKWEEDTLLYLPPFGEWTELASFEDGQFVNIGNGIKRIFKKISEDEIVNWNRNITTARETHDYRIQPDGSLKT